jgi:hypothetical protein
MSINPIDVFLIPVLRSLSDPEFQERIWLRNAGPECYSYAECLDEFFEICCKILGSDELEKIGVPNVSKKLETLKQEIDTFLESNTDEDLQRILSNPKWIEIQKLSKTIYDDLTEVRKKS